MHRPKNWAKSGAPGVPAADFAATHRKHIMQSFKFEAVDWCAGLPLGLCGAAILPLYSALAWTKQLRVLRCQGSRQSRKQPAFKPVEGAPPSN